MPKLPDTFQVFRLEKFIPTHCPKCAHPFKSNEARDFLLDTRLLHSREVAPEWIAVFPEAAAAQELHSDLIWCGKCGNSTLRVFTAVRWVVTPEEAELLERQGYMNRQAAECSGNGFSSQPDYTLTVVIPPGQECLQISFFPKGIANRRPPRPRK